ncbi:hypothetical protein [Aquimarina sp. U1-2]|nr:hypothetical protein [Aquimarina sp. U1-2]
MNQYARVGRVFKKQTPITLVVSTNLNSSLQNTDQIGSETEFDLHTKNI